MTYFVKCVTCEKVQEADYNSLGDPFNPINEETGQKWYSRLKDEKTIHACCHEHIPEKELVWPV